MEAENSLRLVTELCDALVRRHADEPVLPWQWGPALLGFALDELQHLHGDDRYQAWLLRYADHYVGHPPVIHSSDTAAPGLITYALQRTTGDPYYAALTARVIDYLRTAPPAVGGAVNHLGTSPWTLVYRRSVWVDSLMMCGVFAARVGRDESDAALLDVAAAQPRQFAHLLLDPRDHLWAHSHWAPSRLWPGGRQPRGRTYWGRGNGWVVTALPMIVDALGRDHAEAEPTIDLLRRTSAALLTLQRADGTWTTLLTGPRRGYRELSATALIAGGWLHAVRQGYLDEDYRAPAERALHAVLSSLRLVDDAWVLGEVSGPTIPSPVAGRAVYRAMPLLDNPSYGVAALVLATINHEWLSRADAGSPAAT